MGGATVKIELIRMTSAVAGAELVSYLDDDPTTDNITPGMLFETGHPHKRNVIDTVSAGATSVGATANSGTVTNNNPTTNNTYTEAGTTTTGGGGASRMGGRRNQYWKWSAKKFFRPAKGKLV